MPSRSAVDTPRVAALRNSSRSGAVLAFALMTASGFAGLGYQMVWTQQFALCLGSESASLLAVVSAFFGGMALGAMVLDTRIRRSRRPVRWYLGCELLIGAWGLALTWLMPAVSDIVLPIIGAEPSPAWQWGVAFVATFLALLPATAAMGATMPAMERTLGTWQRRGASIAALYAANTSGAVIGVLASAFWLLPELGLSGTAVVCAAMNLLCAAAACGSFASPDSSASPDASRASRRAPWILVATGLLGIGYEVLVVRVISQVAQNTVYTFAILIAVYLVGTAIGASAYRRWSRDDESSRDRLLLATTIACLLGTTALWQADVIQARLLAALLQASQGSPGIGSALLAEAGVCLLAFLPPTIAMGALFCDLATQARASGIGFGRALGFNMIGGAVAPLVLGVLALPAVGPKFALLAVAASYLLLRSRIAWRGLPQALSIGAIAALAVFAPPLVFVDVPEGGRVLSYREGATAAVSVVQDAQGVSRLRIDDRQQEGSSASRYADGRQALLPLLLHPAPHRALFLGLGTGVTASTAAADPSLQVDVVELLPDVIEASRFFADPAMPRPRAIAADARRYVRATDNRYDVVVSDNFHPARSGSGALYTVEHFEAVRARLAPGGLFCQWLPLHQLDLQTLRSIVRAFMVAYPDAAMILATNSLDTPTLGLIGHAQGEHIDLAAVQGRIANAPWPLADYALADRYAVAGSFIADRRALSRFAGDAVVNTDDRPIVSYLAPRNTYAPDSQPRDRLATLLTQFTLSTDGPIDAGPDDTRRLAAYRKARDRFIEAGRRVEPSGDVHAMLAQVREPLLAVLRLSPDFAPAYDPLLRMALALGSDDRIAAKALLEDLSRIQPDRPEAMQALNELSTASH